MLRIDGEPGSGNQFDIHAMGVVVVEQERGHGTLAVRGARLVGEEPGCVRFSCACWNMEMPTATQSEKTLAAGVCDLDPQKTWAYLKLVFLAILAV